MREVFFESTASNDVLVDKNGDPLDVDTGGSGGNVPLHSYFRINTSGGKLLGSSSARDVTYGLPWTFASPIGSGTQHEAPISTESASGEVNDTIILNEGGLWLFDFTLTANSQGSVQNWDHVMMFLTFMVDGGVVEWLRHVAGGDGDDFGQYPFLASGNMSVVRSMPADARVQAAMNADGQWRVLSADGGGTGINFWGTSLGVTYLGPSAYT